MTAQARARFGQHVLPQLDEAYRFAWWLTGNPRDAEDIMQEASLRAFRAVEDCAEGGTRAWFLTIVRTTCYAWLPLHRPDGAVSGEDPGPPARAARGGAASEGPPVGTQAHLAQAVEALPVPLREALVLREYHGLSYREIAEVSAVPIGTVMARLAEARRQLIASSRADSR